MLYGFFQSIEIKDCSGRNGLLLPMQTLEQRNRLVLVVFPSRPRALLLGHPLDISIALTSFENDFPTYKTNSL